MTNQIQTTDIRKLNREERGKLIFQSGRLRKKILCYNICCVIQEINELGVKAEFKLEETKEI